MSQVVRDELKEKVTQIFYGAQLRNLVESSQDTIYVNFFGGNFRGRVHDIHRGFAPLSSNLLVC